MWLLDLSASPQVKIVIPCTYTTYVYDGLRRDNALCPRCMSVERGVYSTQRRMLRFMPFWQRRATIVRERRSLDDAHHDGQYLADRRRVTIPLQSEQKSRKSRHATLPKSIRQTKRRRARTAKPERGAGRGDERSNRIIKDSARKSERTGWQQLAEQRQGTTEHLSGKEEEEELA